MATKYIIDNLAEQTISGSLSATSFSADTFYGDGSNLTGISGGSFTGGTVSGETIFDGGLSATTFSATTIDLCTSNGTLYTDSISGCSPINILSPTNFTEPISANTIYISGNQITQPYKVYTALLSQTGTTPPFEFSILENTLNATVTWSRNNPGEYTGTFNVALPVESTFILIGSPFAGGNNGYCFASYDSFNQFTLTSTIKVYSAGGPNKVSDASDNILDYTPIEIRVYN